LDAGCGLGGSSLWLARERGAVVDGITISEKQVKVAKGLAAGMKLGDRARFHLKDFAATEFPDASFDVVWAIESITHTVDKSEFFREAYRVLRPGGRLILADWFVENYPRNPQEDDMLRDVMEGNAAHIEPPAVFAREMQAAGFTPAGNWDATDEVIPSSTLIKRLWRWVELVAPTPAGSKHDAIQLTEFGPRAGNAGASLGWDQATSIPPLRMVFEIGECILPVILIRRSHRFVIEVNNPFILFGINRGFPRQGQPHEAARALRSNTFASREERLAEQSLRLEVSFTGGEK
jgi:methyltransferase family protein